MLTLSTAAILEKNALSNTGAWVLLLEITLPDTTVIRVCSNTDDITWPSSGGNTWVAFPFELDEIGEASKGEVPSVEVRVGNVSRVMQAYMEAADGGVGSMVRIMVVHSAHLDLTDPEIELSFEVVDAKADSKWARFTLGGTNPSRKRFPRNRMTKNFCRYKVFKGARCQYAGAETECDRTLTRCRALNNSEHFGGCPGIGQKGLYVNPS